MNRWQAFPSKKTEYRGHVYDSKKEADYAATLDLEVKAGEVESWEHHVKFRLVVNGFLICVYELDFIVRRRNGVVEYVDVKPDGVGETPEFRLKWKLLQALYGQGGIVFRLEK